MNQPLFSIDLDKPWAKYWIYFVALIGAVTGAVVAYFVDLK